MKRLSTFREGYFLASVLLKDKMIFLTISNSIPHVNGVSGSGRARSIALEILFSVTYTRDSSCSSPSNLKLSSPPPSPFPYVGGILRMKGMKIETSASCLSGHFRSAASGSRRHPEWNFLEDFSRHTCPAEGLDRRVLSSSPVAQSCNTRARVVRTDVVRVYVRGPRQVNAHPTRRYLRKASRRGVDGYT